MLAGANASPAADGASRLARGSDAAVSAAGTISAETTAGRQYPRSRESGAGASVIVRRDGAPLDLRSFLPSRHSRRRTRSRLTSAATPKLTRMIEMVVAALSL